MTTGGSLAWLTHWLSFLLSGFTSLQEVLHILVFFDQASELLTAGKASTHCHCHKKRLAGWLTKWSALFSVDTLHPCSTIRGQKSTATLNSSRKVTYLFSWGLGDSIKVLNCIWDLPSSKKVPQVQSEISEVSIVEARCPSSRRRETRARTARDRSQIFSPTSSSTSVLRRWTSPQYHLTALPKRPEIFIKSDCQVEWPGALDGEEHRCQGGRKSVEGVRQWQEVHIYMIYHQRQSWY